MSITPLGAPALLRLTTADDDETRLIERMLQRLVVVNAANREAQSYYDGSHVAEVFGISIPPSMRNLHTVAGWGGTCVDVLDERLDWLGWSTVSASDSQLDPLGLDSIFADNHLDVDSGMAQLDALIFGLSFVTVGTGEDGEPSPLITPHSPMTMTGEWDRRARRLGSAVAIVAEEGGQVVEVTTYQPGITSTFQRRNGTWTAVGRDRHNLDRLPVVLLPNRVRGSREVGRSEITKAVRYYTDAACRTLLGLEVNREFYNAPQRVGLNIDESMFQDASGNPVSQWTAIMGRIWNVPPNEDGMPAPDIKQFNPSSPAPYIDQVKGYATLLSAEAGIPANYLGFQTDNPASADAIRAGEARLVKRAERRQVAFGRAWLEVGRMALMVRDGEAPDDFAATTATRWRDAATPTRAAAADEATKLIASGVLPPDSAVTYDRVGLSPAEQRIVTNDKRRAAGRGVLQALRDAAGGGTDTAD